MNSALVLLSRYKLRGLLRKSARAFRSPRGTLLAGVMVIVFVLGVGSNAVTAIGTVRTSPEQVRLFAPFAILGFVLLQLLTTSGDKALAFTAAEVDFLFPGPFSRRQLALYNLLGGVAGEGLTALIFSLLFMRWSTWWIAGWLGMWLAFLFIRLSSAALALAITGFGGRRSTIVRATLSVSVLILATQGAMEAFAAGGVQSLGELAERFRGSQGGAIVLAPFEPFGRTIAAERLAPDFVMWCAASMALVVVMVAIVLQVDASYMEAAVVASERRYEIMQRARRGRAPVIAARRAVRWRVPSLPWLGGAGPIAWRQATELLRSSPRTYMTMFAMSIGIVPAMLMGRGDPADLIGPAIGMTAWLGLMVTAIIPLGFRADLDYMDWLKSAPVRPLAVAIGELMPAALFMALLQSTVLLGIAVWIAAATEILLAALAFTLPANLLLLTAENLVFLWFPTRVAISPGDLQFMGRQMLMLMVRMLLVGVAVGIAGAYVGVVSLFGVESPLILGAIAWCVLCIEGIGGIFLVAWAFRRFDPSIDMPA